MQRLVVPNFCFLMRCYRWRERRGALSIVPKTGLQVTPKGQLFFRRKRNCLTFNFKNYFNKSQPPLWERRKFFSRVGEKVLLLILNIFFDTRRERHVSSLILLKIDIGTNDLVPYFHSKAISTALLKSISSAKIDFFSKTERRDNYFLKKIIRKGGFVCLVLVRRCHKLASCNIWPALVSIFPQKRKKARPQHR